MFVAWLLTVTVFDKQVYMVFTPGQLRVCLEIGGGETAYDTMGMVVQKQRDDIFRHWVLGLGSGDLIVRTSGANHHEFVLSNVLFIGTKLNHVSRDAARQADRGGVRQEDWPQRTQRAQRRCEERKNEKKTEIK